MDDNTTETPEMDRFEQRCFILNITAFNGIWHGDNPFSEPLPIFIVQLGTILIITRFLYHLFKPLNQPRIVSDILGGILLGKSALGKITFFSDMFPTRNVHTVETLGYMALVLHMFLVGLELDLKAISRISQKAIIVTVSGLFLPFIVGICFFYLLHEFFAQETDENYKSECGFLWAASLAVTSFPTVCRILSDLKLRNSEIGRLALPIALISDLGSWILIVIVIPFCANPINAPYVIITTTAYILVSVYSIRPFVTWIVDYTSENDKNYSDFYLCFALVGVVLNAFFTDVTGTHPILGAFVFGLIMPNDLAVVLVDRFYFFISGLLLPVFFTAAGIKVDIFKVTKWGLIFVVLILLCVIKTISFLPISFVSDVSTIDSLALGLLMSTKGIWAILIVLTALEKKVLLAGEYAVTMIAILLMNSMVGPVIATIYKRTNLFMKNNSKSMLEAQSDPELRILVCIHSFCNVPGIIKLLDATHDSRQNRMTIFTLHLVELQDRLSPMLIVHDSNSPRFEDSLNAHHDYYSSETDQIVTAFTEFEQRTRNIEVQSLTSVSPSISMHGDICSLAEDKLVTFLILPFHKQATKEGGLQETFISSFRSINQNVLPKAPCSVGIFIERGVEAAKLSDKEDQINEIAVLFIGGPDDCEALAYAWRMATKPGVRLTVIRLLEFDSLDSPKQNDIDEEYINEFRLQTADEELIAYEEKTLQDGEELIAVLKEIENDYELFIVGRRDGLDSPLTTELVERVDCPELGVIGDLLAVSDSANSSVLVVQQYVVLISSQVIEELVGTEWSKMDRSVMQFGSRRLANASTNRLWLYSKSKKATTTMERRDSDDDNDDDK